MSTLWFEAVLRRTHVEHDGEVPAVLYPVLTIFTAVKVRRTSYKYLYIIEGTGLSIEQVHQGPL